MTNNNPDIFDKIVALIPISLLQSFYAKNKMMLLYIFFGGVSFFINIGLFALIDEFSAIDVLINNIICWIVCVLFQFVTNKIWVFESREKNTAKALKELVDFSVGRVLTLLTEELLLYIFINLLSFSSLPVKIVVQIVVIVLNYFISKFWVFR